MYHKLSFNKLNNVFHNCFLFIKYIMHIIHQQFLISTCIIIFFVLPTIMGN